MQKTRSSKYLVAALAAVTTLIAYLPALRNDFVQWDDNLYIFENPHIRSLDAAFFRWAFFDFHASNWHPVTWISHAVDYALWGLNPLGHHLTSIVLHAANTLIVVLLIIQFLEAAKKSASEAALLRFLNERTTLIVACVTGLLFGLHPVHVESVAWVSERKDLLCALFFLLSIMRYAKFAGSQGSGVRSQKPEDRGKSKADPKKAFINKHYLLSLGFFVLALMSKPMAVTLPVVLLILDWHPFGRIRSFKTLWLASVEKIPFFALSLASSIITILAQRAGGSITSIEQIPLSIRIAIAAKSLIAYLGKMLLPLDLIPLYPYPRDASLFSGEHVSAIILAVGITAVCVVLVKRQKFWLSAWGYYVVTLIPVLGIVQVGGQAMADRYTYLPSLGPFLIVGSSVAWISTGSGEGWGWRGHRFVIAAVLLVCAPLSYLTVRQIHIWKDSIALWSYELKMQPAVHRAYVNRGIAHMERGQFEKAREDYSRAISLNSSDFNAYYNRGILFANLNLIAQAIDDYNAAITLNPLLTKAYHNRGALYQKMGQFEKAYADYNMAISLNPSNARLYMNRGLVYNSMGQLDRALADLARAISLDPNDPDAYYNRGLIFDRIGQLDRALTDFDAVISLKPTYYEAYYNRGLVLQKIGQFDKAGRDLMIWKEHSVKQ